MLSTKRQIASSVALLLAMANNDRDRGVQFSFQRKRWRKQREHNERNTLETSMKQLGLDLNVAKETHTCAENIYTYPFGGTEGKSSVICREYSHAHVIMIVNAFRRTYWRDNGG